MNLKTAGASIAVVGALAGGGTVVTDQAINPYDSVGTTLQAETVSTLPEAGTEKVMLDTTKPKMTLSKWNNEVNMSVTYAGIQATGARPFLSKNVEWKEGNQTMQVAPLDKSATLEDGGYEINIILDAKPASNVFNFSIDGASNLDFFFQPPLTAQEIKQGASRPDNVIGSYAVYYKNHKDHVEGQTNYATGKAYHIFRPKVTDASGHEVWADLSYEGGTLSVTVPQTFLDTATYPVTIDPTFGYTTAGGTGITAWQKLWGEETSPDSGTITSISAYLNSTAVNINFGYYLSGGGFPSTQIAHGTAIANPATTDWKTISVSGSITASIIYQLNIQSSSPTGISAFADTVSSFTYRIASGAAFDTWGNSPGSSSGAANTRLSIYATYTPTAQPIQNNQTIFFQ